MVRHHYEGGNMLKGIVISAVVSITVWLLLVWAVAAKANYQDQRLNTIASNIAGHDVVVSCSASEHEWVSFEDAGFPGQNFDADGFTTASRSNVIYLAPRVCDTLEGDLHVGVASVGDYWNGLAIKVLVHEALHQRGITDESQTDCTALTLVKQYALSLGYTANVT